MSKQFYLCLKVTLWSSSACCAGDYVYLFDIDSQVSKNQFSKNLDSNSWKQSSMDGEAGEARAFCQTSDDARNIQNSGDRTAGSSWMVREAESMHEATIANPNIDSDTLSSAIGSDNQSQSLHQSPNPGVVSDARIF